MNGNHACGPIDEFGVVRPAEELGRFVPHPHKIAHAVTRFPSIRPAANVQWQPPHLSRWQIPRMLMVYCHFQRSKLNRTIVAKLS